MTGITTTRMPLNVAIGMANQSYRDQNKTKKQAELRKIRQENKDENNAYRREWYHKNIDQCRKKCRDYYLANKEDINKRRKEQREKINGQIHVQK